MVIKCEVNDEVVKLLRDVIRLNVGVWKDLPDLEDHEQYTEERFLSMTKLPEKEVLGGSIYPSHRCVHLPTEEPNTAVALKHVRCLLNSAECTNAVMYPPYSIMDWHTNRNTIGERIYYVYNLKRGIFRYIDPETKEIVVDYDDEGWTCRRFRIEYYKPLWHSVWSEGRRFAFGFNTKL